MTQAKSGVTLTNAGLPYLHFRSAGTGGVVLEGREESMRNEEALTERFRDIFNDEKEANVSQPLKNVSEYGHVRHAVRAGSGNCQPRRLQRIVGQVRACKTSMVMCPVAAARRITAAGRTLLGWARIRARVTPPMPCYRCMETYGHFRYECSTGVDCSERC